MKNVKWFFPVMLLTFAILSFSSCDNDFDLEPDGADSYYDDNFDDENNDGGNSGNQGGGSDNSAGSLDSDYGISLYRVDGENIIQTETNNSPNSWMNDQVKHNDMWNIVKELVPTDRRQWISSFEIFDGQQELLGYVVNTTEDLSQWKFGLDIASAYPDNENLERSGDFIYTVIHEYGHILSLNNTQLNGGQHSCENYNPGEGCAFEASYIDEFHERFWEDIASEAQNINPDDYDAVDEFYNKYQDRFVTNYAATNPAEDIAEVFSVFVTSANQPTGDQIKDQKVRMLYEYPELVELRNHMRGTSFTIPKPGTWAKPKCCLAHTHKARF